MRISTAVNAVGITGYGESVTYQQSRVKAGGGGGVNFIPEIKLLYDSG